MHVAHTQLVRSPAIYKINIFLMRKQNKYDYLFKSPKQGSTFVILLIVSLRNAQVKSMVIFREEQETITSGLIASETPTLNPG